MKKIFGTATFALLLGLCWLLPAQAADSEGIARVALITPKEGHSDALVKAITDYHKWMANFEGHMEYQWFAITAGQATGKFIARTGGHNWADFDAKHDWSEESDAVFERNISPHVQSVEIWYTQEMPEYSHLPEDMTGYTHFYVEDWYVQPGMNGKFRRDLKKIVDTLKAGGFTGYWRFASVEVGGHGGQIQLVTPNRGWAGMSEKDPSFYSIVSEALGGPEAFEALMSDWGATFKVGESRMVEWMPEASDYGE